MNFTVQDKLDNHEYPCILNFFDSLHSYCIEQHPDWVTKIEGYRHTFLIGADDNSHIACFANIILSNGPFKTAHINFGPAFNSIEVLVKAVQFLHKYFNSKNFIFFSIQLGTNISNQTELFEYNINRDFVVTYHFKPQNLWASICVDITKTENEILKSFSKGHKSSIKSVCSKNELRISVENNPEHLKLFIDLYNKMMEVRKLPFDKKNTTKLFHSVNDFIYEKNKGFIEYIFDGDNLVGGLIILYQGNSVRYYKGAGDPERRDIPILHFGLYEAMKISKANGFITFDLWGYNHFVDETNQIFFLNRFKKGFGGYFTFFPKRMNFILKPTHFFLYNILKLCKNRLKALSLSGFKK